MIADMVGRLVSPIVIGRRAELDTAMRAFDAALAGAPVHLLVAGEAGVGKSRLVAEIERLAHERGALVLRGESANVGEGGLPYAPIVEALRGLARALPPAALAEVVGPSGADLARLLPALSPTPVAVPVQQQWLQVTLKASDASDLPGDDVFYFGNAIGETGNNSSNSFVDGSDFVGVRDHPRSFLNRASVSDLYDINRDSLVNGSDLILVRDHTSNFLTALKLLAAPPGGGAMALPAGGVPARVALSPFRSSGVPPLARARKILSSYIRRRSQACSSASAGRRLRGAGPAIPSASRPDRRGHREPAAAATAHDAKTVIAARGEAERSAALRCAATLPEAMPSRRRVVTHWPGRAARL
jgi:hypothetical protein